MSVRQSSVWSSVRSWALALLALALTGILVLALTEGKLRLLRDERPSHPYKLSDPAESHRDFRSQTQDVFNSYDEFAQIPQFDPPVNSLQELHYALETMQNEFFRIWLGKWPDAIDWTAAVMGTHVAGVLQSLSRSLPYIMPGTLSTKYGSGREGQSQGLSSEGQRIENEINKYFSQAVTYFFGEDAFAIRTQAYDDMLWVVLGWLDNIRFINEHDELHYAANRDSNPRGQWYGKQFTSAFAHRARVFYDLAGKGWDWKLCGGGMNWNPHTKLPYKNAITNELFIAASAGMYLHFPGDDNCSPFLSGKDSQSNPNYRNIMEEGDGHCEPPNGPALPHDPKYLEAAKNGYHWLKNSKMTNEQGLYVDGFHVTDYGKNGSIGTGKCDARNEMVYTYNQGVLLSGLRGLWEGTGDLSYLEDGHELIRNVIAATGWACPTLQTRVFFVPPSSHISKPHVTLSGGWAGLGASGILMEICDPRGACSQNGQTFKGIFFHHLVRFCSPLPETELIPGVTHKASREEAMLHRQSCKEYAKWVVHNAQAALATRDASGRFGGWWGAKASQSTPRNHGDPTEPRPEVLEPVVPEGAKDYRNGHVDESFLPYSERHGQGDETLFGAMQNSPLGAARQSRIDAENVEEKEGDLNDRGRGRTVETQGGGVAVVRAMWEFVNMYTRDD